MAFACLLRLLPKDQIYNRIIVYEPLPPFSSIESPIYLHQALISQQQPPAGQPCPAEPCLKRFIFWNKYSRWFHPASPLNLHCPLSLFVNVLGNERKVTEACSSPPHCSSPLHTPAQHQAPPDSAFTTCTFSTQAVLQTGLSVKLTTFLLNI